MEYWSIEKEFKSFLYITPSLQYSNTPSYKTSNKISFLLGNQSENNLWR